MEWALAILFSAAVILLIASILKTWKSSISIEQQVDQLSITFLNEVNKLEEQVQNIELDTDIVFQETGILEGSAKQRILLREALNLHRRGYSMESIATKSKLSESEVDQLLAPYIQTRNERSLVSSDS